MLKLVIFDFDGVIADSEPTHFELFQVVLKGEGLKISWQQYCEKYLGYDDIECFETILKDLGKPDSQRARQLAKQKSELFTTYMRDHCQLMPGVKELLLDLKAHHILCSISSGALSHEIQIVLEQTQLQQYFTAVVGADHVQASKPDPESYRLSLERTNETLNCQPPILASQCLAIEDSIWGIESAKGAQMTCLAVETSYPKEQLTKADAAVKDLTEVNAQILLEMVNHS